MQLSAKIFLHHEYIGIASKLYKLTAGCCQPIIKVLAVFNTLYPRRRYVKNRFRYEIADAARVYQELNRVAFHFLGKEIAYLVNFFQSTNFDLLSQVFDSFP